MYKCINSYKTSRNYFYDSESAIIRWARKSKHVLGKLKCGRHGPVSVQCVYIIIIFRFFYINYFQSFNYLKAVKMLFICVYNYINACCGRLFYKECWIDWLVYEGKNDIFHVSFLYKSDLLLDMGFRIKSDPMSGL